MEDGGEIKPVSKALGLVAIATGALAAAAGLVAMLMGGEETVRIALLGIYSFAVGMILVTLGFLARMLSED